MKILCPMAVFFVLSFCLMDATTIQAKGGGILGFTTDQKAITVQPSGNRAYLKGWLATEEPNSKRPPISLAALTKELGNLPFSLVYDGKPWSDCIESWRLEKSTKRLDKNRKITTLSYTDPQTGLEVCCQFTEFRDFPAVEWVLNLTNHGDKDTPIIEDIQALDLLLANATSKATLHYSLGDSNSARSFEPVERSFGADKPEVLSLSPEGGRSSDGYMPFFNIERADASIAIAVGWSGQWRASFEQTSQGTLRVQAGQELTHFKLLPGESARSPRILLVFWKGKDDLSGNNLLRQLMMKHYMPRRNGELLYSPICGSVGYTDPDGTYDGPHIRAMPVLSKIGVEVFWSDMDPQQWYPKGFPAGTGTWEPDLQIYPDGLAPIGKAAHDAGLEYLLWFEPERVQAGTRIWDEHKDYVLDGGQGTGLFKLGDPEARKWLTDYIDVQIEAAKLDWVRWDFNVQPLSFWRSNDAADRQGITEIRHVEGLYAMWDDLRARHPGLVIDNCASGGRRIDLETMSRGLPLWHSDLQCVGPSPTAEQLQNGGLFRWIPMHGTAAFGLEPSYGFRCAMTAGNIVVPFVLGHPAAAGIAEDAAIKTVSIYKKIRPFMLGDFYPIFPHDASDKAWYGYQFHRPDLDAGFAVIFRRENSAESRNLVKLKGIREGKKYEITFEDSSEIKRVRSTDSLSFETEIPSAPGAAILWYRSS